MVTKLLAVVKRPYDVRFNKYFSILFFCSLIYSMQQNYGLGFWLSVYLIYFLTFGLGVGMTLHRVISHSAVPLPKPFLYFFATLGSIAQVGTPINWLLGHNLHHKYADSDKDPILPYLRGANHLLGLFIPTDEKEYTRMLLVQARSPVFKDWFLKSLNDYLYQYTFGIYLLVYLIFGPISFNAFLIGNLGALIATSLLTYFSHVKSLGTQHHEMSNNSVNIYGTFLIFFGEEIHNNHHAYPKRISNSQSATQVDPIGWVLRLF